LCVIPISVPPLRERGDDALLLSEMFLAQLNSESDEKKTLSAQARTAVLEYAWPGNVRELKNVIHRAFVLLDGEIDLDIEVDAAPAGAIDPKWVDARAAAASAPVLRTASMLASAGESFAVRIPVGMSLEDAERALITATLKAVAGSK